MSKDAEQGVCLQVTTPDDMLVAEGFLLSQAEQPSLTEAQSVPVSQSRQEHAASTFAAS